MAFDGAINKISESLTTPLFSLRNHDVSIKSIIVLIALFWGFLWLSKWLEKLIHKSLVFKDIDPGIKGAIERFSRYFVLLVGMFVSLGSIGINLNSFAALGAVVGVGLGFGLQSITTNFMSGLIILLERPIKKGDIVQVGNTSGRVIDIRARSTLILTRDDVVIIVPNSSFITEQVVNDSFSGDKLRLHINVRVSYDCDVDSVTKVLLAVAAKQDKVLQNPPPTVVLKEFGEAGLIFNLRVWTSELWYSDFLLSDLRYEIVRQFRDNQITIPYPQREVHIKAMLDSEAEVPKKLRKI